jgi:hypothetical protein
MHLDSKLYFLFLDLFFISYEHDSEAGENILGLGGTGGDRVRAPGFNRPTWPTSGRFKCSLSYRKLVDERGFEPPASSLRKQKAKLDGAKTDEKE